METFIRNYENRIWVRGNDDDPGQVIAVLEARGGRNRTGLPGRCPELAYYISSEGVIACCPLDSDKGRLLQEMYGELHLKGVSCADCMLRKFPPCDMGIPCCRCDVEECNSRQPCPQKMEGAL